MLNKQKIIVIVLLALLLGVLGYVTYHISETNKARNTDAARTLGAEDTTQYTNLHGEIISLSSFDGRVRVVNSWASWSPFSKTELQDLNRLAEAYAAENIAVIAINRNEEPARARSFIDTLGALPHVNFLIDKNDTFYSRMDGQAMPETLFFDRNGNITHHARGDMSYEAMVEAVEAALASQ